MRGRERAMDHDITQTFERLVRPDPADEGDCERILSYGICCCDAGFFCERCGHASIQKERLLAASVLPRFI